MVQWRKALSRGQDRPMIQNDRLGPFIRRLRLSAREVAIALAWTVAAATFLVTALMGDKTGEGRPVAAMERMPEKM